MEPIATFINLESVAPGDRSEFFASKMAGDIQAQELSAVVESIIAVSDCRPADNESNKDFMDRLHTEGVLKVFSPIKSLPITLFYLNGEPLVGFLPPDVSEKQVAAEVAAVTVYVNLLTADLMPQWGDGQGVKKLILAYKMSKLLGGKG